MDSLPPPDSLEPVAGNGLLHRRLFLAGGAALLGAGGGLLRAAPARGAELPPWMLAPGAGMRPYGERSPREAGIQRTIGGGPGPALPGSGVSRTPLEHLEGAITPSGLHFERHHSGVPDIDPAQHRLLVHGLVERPLTFTMDALLRYPLVSALRFVECGGNSAANVMGEAPQVSCGALHGLVSGSEWTGVPLAVLLQEAGVQKGAKWLLAEGGDAAAMSRSFPLEKALDDALVALYQNGERLRPENGYPVRLLLPGWEGNLQVKWLRRMKLVAGPVMTKDETSKYTGLLPDGRAQQFVFPMEVKSVITSPSGGLALQGPGLYQVSGLAWSGAGRIRRVEVSADAGRSWAEAALDGPVQPKALTRFRIGWRWNGGPAVLQSRAVDETNARQPTRSAWLAARGPQFRYHNNAIQCWQVAADGTVVNVHA